MGHVSYGVFCLLTVTLFLVVKVQNDILVLVVLEKKLLKLSFLLLFTIVEG